MTLECTRAEQHEIPYICIGHTVSWPDTRVYQARLDAVVDCLQRPQKSWDDLVAKNIKEVIQSFVGQIEALSCQFCYAQRGFAIGCGTERGEIPSLETIA
jgi:hypothetical protein